jgi:NADH:ubiquinone oxidoreductase subunit 2 (subunit N)
VGIVNSVVSLFYYIGVVRAMYLMPVPEGASVIPETGVARVLLAVTTLGTIVIGIDPQPFIRLVNAASVIGRF